MRHAQSILQRKAYVSCRGCVGIPQRARFIAVKTGWYRGLFVIVRPWQNEKLILPGTFFIAKKGRGDPR